MLQHRCSNCMVDSKHGSRGTRALDEITVFSSQRSHHGVLITVFSSQCSHGAGGGSGSSRGRWSVRRCNARARHHVSASRVAAGCKVGHLPDTYAAQRLANDREEPLLLKHDRSVSAIEVCRKACLLVCWLGLL